LWPTSHSGAKNAPGQTQQDTDAELRKAQALNKDLTSKLETWKFSEVECFGLGKNPMKNMEQCWFNMV
jgi:hypothetical protein